MADSKAVSTKRSTMMEILVKEVFIKDRTWDDLAEFFVRDKTELQNEFRQYMLGRFEDGEERIKKVEDRIAKNEEVQLRTLEIELGLRDEEP